MTATPAAPTLSFTALTVPQTTVTELTGTTATLSTILSTSPPDSDPATPPTTQVAALVNGALTLECWVKPGGTGATTDTLLWFTAGATTLALTNAAGLTISLGTSTIPTGVVLATGVWQHVSLAVSAPLDGKVAVLLVVDSATAYQAPAALAAPATWLEAGDTQSVGIGAQGSATALAGDYAEVRLWAQALDAALIVTDAFYQLAAGNGTADSGPLLAWPLSAIPANTSTTGASTVAGTINYRSETLTASWAAISGATYNLNVYASDNSWGVSYTGIAATSQAVTAFRVDHGVCAVLQAVVAGVASPWSTVASGQIFRLGVPVPVATATISGATPTYQIDWPAIDQANGYWVALTGLAPQPQATTSFSLTAQLGSATASTVAVAAGYGTVIGPYSPATALATPVVTLTYTVATEGQPGTVMLNWTAVPGATSYYVAWSATGTTTLPQAATIVDASVTSAGPFPAAGTSGISYTANVQALSAQSLGATGTATLTILPVTAPTSLSAVTAPTAGSTPGEITLSWVYSGPTGAAAGYRITIAQANGDFTTSTTSSTTTVTVSDASFTAANWYTATVQYSAGGITGPAATMTVYVLPAPGNFSASWNASSNVISASYNAVTAAGVTASGAALAYDTDIEGPLTGSSCANVPADPTVDTTLGPTTSTTPSWPASDVSGLEVGKAYSAAARTVVQGNASSSLPSACVVLQTYVAPPVPPNDPPTSDPIGITTGAFAYSAVELEQLAATPIVFEINYNSQFPTHSEESAIADGALGMRWRHSFETQLIVDAANGVVTVILGSMAMSSYYYSATAGELSPVGPFQGTRLYRTASGYQLVFSDQSSWTFDAAGLALSLADPSGNSQVLSYASGRLQAVTLANGGASISFGYDGNGKLSSATASGGESIAIAVSSNRLASITVTGIGDWTYSYASSGTALLEQVTDPWGNAEVHNVYDSSARVIEQFTADGYAATPQYSTVLSYGTTSYGGGTVGTTTVTQPEGGVSVYYYDPTSLIVVRKSTDLGGGLSEIVVIAYDGYYQPVTSTLYTGPAASYATGKGNPTSYVYNANRLMSQSIDASGRAQSWDYDGSNNLLAYSDIWGNTTTYSYGTGNLRLTSTTPMGLTTRYAYWPQATYGFTGLPETVTDPFGNVTTIDYFSASGLPKSVTDPGENVTAYTYDSAGRQNSEAHSGADGSRLSYTTSAFDNLDRLTRVTVQMAAQASADAYVYDYAYGANSIAITYPADLAGDYVLTLGLNGDRNVTSRAYQPFGSTVVQQTTGYDQNGRIASVALGARSPTVYAYNALDQLVSVTDPLGNTRTIAQQQIVDSGNGPYPTEQVVTAPLLSYLDTASGLSTDYVYTETTVRDPGGLITGVTATLAAAATPNVPVWQQSIAISYTATAVAAAGAVPAYHALTVTTATTAVMPAGATITSSETTNGEYVTVATTDALGHSTTIAYAPATDPAGSDVVMLKQTTSPPAGAAVDLYYDPSSQPVAYAAGSGIEARAALYAYDALGRLAQVRVGDTLANLAGGVLTAAGAAQTSFTYQSDSTAGVARLRVDATQPATDPEATPIVAQSTYYDAFDHVVAESFAGGSSYDRTYAPWGSVASWAIPSGGTIGFGFDTAGSLVSVTPSGGDTITHVLDDTGNRLQTYLAGTLAVTRGFDAWNRLVLRTENGATIQQTQWPNGLLRTLTYPDGKTVGYAINGFGQWSSVTDWAARTTSYAYLATGQLQTATFPNGVVASFGYNAAGAPTAFAVKTAANFVLTQLAYTPNQHNEPGAASGIWPLPPALPDTAATLTYTNDTLTAYDGAALTSNADAALTQIPAPDGGNVPAAVAYLPDGPLESVGGTSYDYDADGMLAGATRGGSTASYVVAPNAFQDPLLNMGSAARATSAAVQVSTFTAGETLLPVFGSGAVPPGADQAADMVLQIAEQGATSARFIHGLGPIGRELADGTIAYFHADPAGNVVALTGASGAPAGTYVYGPYGVRSASGTAPFYGFSGRFGVIDDGSGLLAMRARFYSPQLMRFTARDLLAGDAHLPTARNRFVYGLDNPLVYADPLGLNFWHSVTKSITHAVSDILSGFRKALGTIGSIAAGVAALAGLAALAAKLLTPTTPPGYDPVPGDDPDAPSRPPPRPSPTPPRDGVPRRRFGGNDYQRLPQEEEIEMTELPSSNSSTSPRTPTPKIKTL